MITTIMHSQRLRRLHRANITAKLNHTVTSKEKHSPTDSEALAILIIMFVIGIAVIVLPLNS